MKKYLLYGAALVGVYFLYKKYFGGGSPLNGSSANKAAGNGLTGTPQ